MEEISVFRCLDQRCNLGKIGDKKYQHKAIKDVERKLSSLSKRINDLQNQKKLAYKNALKVKKTIHIEINQIIKSFQTRERILLHEVDEAFHVQDTLINDDLTKLLLTHSCCHALFTSLEDFKDNQSVLTKINDFLSSVSVEKPAVNQLVFNSWVESAKAVANEYGHLDGDFSEKNEFSVARKTGKSSALFSTQSLDKCDLEEQFCSESSQIKCFDISSMKNFKDNVKKRERTESQDSFEIVDLLEDMQCQDDENSDGIKMDYTPFTANCLSVKNIQQSDIFDDNFDKTSSNVEGEMKKLMNELPERTRRLFSGSSSKEDQFTIHHKAEKENDIQRTIQLTDEDRSWLCKLPYQKDIKTNENSLNNKLGTSLIGSPADVIRMSFRPFFGESNTNWLSSR